jgi:hypothetical protein
MACRVDGKAIGGQKPRPRRMFMMPLSGETPFSPIRHLPRGESSSGPGGAHVARATPRDTTNDGLRYSLPMMDSSRPPLTNCNLWHFLEPQPPLAVPGGRVCGTLPDHPLLFGHLSRVPPVLAHLFSVKILAKRVPRDGGEMKKKDSQVARVLLGFRSRPRLLVSLPHLSGIWLFSLSLFSRFRGTGGRNNCAKWVSRRLDSCERCMICYGPEEGSRSADMPTQLPLPFRPPASGSLRRPDSHTAPLLPYAGARTEVQTGGGSKGIAILDGHVDSRAVGA